MMNRLFVAVLAVLALSLPPAQAEPRDMPEQMDGIADQLGLSGDQRRVVADLLYQYSMKRIDLQAARDRSGLELKRLLSAQTLDEKAVRAALDTLTGAETGLRQIRVELMISLRKVLSYEQWTQLESLYLREDRRGPPPPEPRP